MSEPITELHSIQISDEQITLKAQDIKKQVEESFKLSFENRVNHPKWQVRKKLYEQMYQIIQTSQSLSNLDPSFIEPEILCIWIKNLLDQPHPSSLNEAIKVIQLFTQKYRLGIKEINCFFGFLIQKSAAANSNINKFQSILENCFKEQHISIMLMFELAKYAQSKNNKMALLSLKGLKMIVDKFEVSEKKHIDLLFELNIRILESSVQKEIRSVSLQIMSQLIKYSKQPFETLVQTKFKKIRPIVLKQLKGLISNNPSMTTIETIGTQQDIQSQEVDLRALAPSKLFYLDTVHNFNQKKSIILQFQQTLQKNLNSTTIKKDYFQIYNVVQSLLQESNQIISSMGLKILKMILKIQGQHIPDSNLKRFFSLTCDRYKGSKSQSLNQQIHSVINIFFKNKEHQPQVLVDMSFQVIDKSKNQNSKTGIIDWWASEYPKIFQFKFDNKLKQLNIYIKKKIQQTKKTKNYLLIKSEMQNLNLSLNNMETVQNRTNVHKMIKTQPLKKQKSRESNVLSFTQAMKMSTIDKNQPQKQPRSKNKREPEFSTLEANQSYLSSYQSPSREPSILQSMQMALKGVKKSIITNNQHSIQVYFSDFNTLISKTDGQFFQIINIIMTFVDQLLFSDLKKSKISHIKQMEYVFQEISKSIIKLNKQTFSIDQQSIKLQLQLILTKLQLSNIKILETLLDSLYMCSTLHTLLKATLIVCKNCQYFCTQVRQFYINWLSMKIQLGSVDANILLSLVGQFEMIDKKISKSILKKCNKYQIFQQEPKQIVAERVSFMTPKKDVLRSSSIQSSRSRAASLQTSRNNSVIVSQDVILIQQLLLKDYIIGVRAFDQLLDKQELRSSKRRFGRGSNLQKLENDKQYHKIIKHICKYIEPKHWNEVSKVLIRYFTQYQQSRTHLLQMFLVFSCTKIQFKEHKEHHMILNFLEILMESLDTSIILSYYKSSFQYIYLKMPNFQTQTFLIITLPFLISRILHNELSLNQYESLINPLCFCLLYPTTYNISNIYLDKLHRGKRTPKGKIQQSLRSKIKDELLRNAYDQWLHKYAIDQMEIGTISEVPQLMDDISNCKSLVDGLQQFANKSLSSNSLRFTSPIVGLSKIRDIQSEKRGQIVREASKSSTIQRPISILKNFHSSRQILQQSMQHHTQIHHFQDINDTRQMVEMKQMNQIKEIDTYQFEKQQLTTLLPKQISTQINDSIRQLRQLFLTSESNPEQIIQNLWEMYTSLQSQERQDRFVKDLKVSIMNPNFILSLSETNYYVLLSFILKMCSNIPVQKHQSQTSYYLRQLLNLLLTYKNPNTVLIICVRILNHHLTEDFQEHLQFQQKLMFRLITNCIQRLASIIQPSQMRSFQVLLQIYKFFKVHPPQNLIEGIPSLKQIQGIFNSLKKVTNVFIQGNKSRSQEFILFIKRKNMNNIYLNYVTAVVDRQ